MDHHGTVVDAVALAQRGTDDEYRTQVGACLHDRPDRVVRSLEQRVLQEQVVDRVAGQAQLGEERHRDAFVVTAAGLCQDGLRVGPGVADGDRQRAGGDPREPVRVGRFEVHTHSVTERVPRMGGVHPPVARTLSRRNDVTSTRTTPGAHTEAEWSVLRELLAERGADLL